MKTISTICFVAGKSGGHIVPCLTLAREAKTKEPRTHILFFSTRGQIDARILNPGVALRQAQSYAGHGNNPLVDTHIALPISQLKPKKIYQLPIILWHLMRSFFSSLRHLIKHKPQRVISTGGFIAIPVTLAARILRIPVELYELNVQPGSAIKFLAPFAHTVHTCFKKTQRAFKSYHCTHTPYPVRFAPSDKHLERDHAIKRLSLEPKRTTVLVLGGSQGSQFMNHAIKQLVKNHPELHTKIQLIHQTSAHTTAKLRTFYDAHTIPAHVFAYEDDMKAHYSAADVVLSRAGAGTLFEILFFNKPCIIIPLETANNNHQLFNAQEMVVNYQRLFTMMRQQQLEKNPQILFNVMSRYINVP